MYIYIQRKIRKLFKAESHTSDLFRCFYNNIFEFTVCIFWGTVHARTENEN